MKILNGITTGIYIGLKGSIQSSPTSQIQLTLEGIVGDKHAGLTSPASTRSPHYPPGAEIRNSRQVSILSEEDMAEIAAALGLPHIQGDWLGANLVVKGISRLSLLPPSSRVFFEGDAALVVQGEINPCTQAGQTIQDHYPDVQNVTARFPKAALHYRGAVAWVEYPGQIHLNEPFSVEIPEQTPYQA